MHCTLLTTVMHSYPIIKDHNDLKQDNKNNLKPPPETLVDEPLIGYSGKVRAPPLRIKPIPKETNGASWSTNPSSATFFSRGVSPDCNYLYPRNG